MTTLRNNRGQIFAVVKTTTEITDYGTIYGFVDEIFIPECGLSSDESAILDDYIESSKSPHRDVWDQYSYDIIECDYDTFYDMKEAL